MNTRSVGETATRDPWQPVEGRCNARKPDQSGLCRNPAGKGTDHVGFGHCSRHGGSTKNGEKFGARLRAQGQFGQLLEECGVETKGRTFAEGLQDALDRCASVVSALGFLVAELDEDSSWSWSEHKGQRGGVDRWVIVEKLGLVGPNASGEQTVNAVFRAYGEWIDRYSKVVKMAADLGLAERITKLHEDAGAALVRVLEGVCADLGIVMERALEALCAENGWDVATAKQGLARHLRLVGKAS